MEGVQGKPGIEERSHGNEHGTNMAACFMHAFFIMLQFDNLCIAHRKEGVEEGAFGRNRWLWPRINEAGY